MNQRNRRPSTSKHTHHLPLIVGGVLIVLCIVIAGIFLIFNARPNSTSSAQPTPTPPVNIPVAVTTTPVATSTHVTQQPIKLIPVTVSAYSLQGAMADGKPTHVGACAVSTAQFPLGTILYLYNPDGSFNRQCIAEDTGSNVQVGQIDIAMPGDTAGATRWGIRHLLARVVRWGWGNRGSPTPLPTP